MAAAKKMTNTKLAEEFEKDLKEEVEELRPLKQKVNVTDLEEQLKKSMLDK